MKVYHGSYIQIEEIDLSKSIPNKDFGMNEQTAADKFFSSETFSKVSGETTGLYEKPWQEIYEMLKTELNLSR